MSDNSALVISQAACLIATVLGMEAENKQREHRGESMAYVEADFQNAIQQSGIGWNDAVGLLRGAR